MFFILSINPSKHTVRIVAHAATLEQAIALVSEHADAYVKSKNAPVMHRGDEEVKLTDRIIFFTKKVPQQDYQIDVFRQQTHQVRSWTGTAYRDEQILVRRFCYTEYSALTPLPCAAQIPLPPQLNCAAAPLPPPPAPPANKLKVKLSNTIGGFPQDVIESLCQNERFQQSRINAELNKLPPPFAKHNVFSAPRSDDESFDEVEDEEE